MSASDLVIAAVIVAAALLLLYTSLRRTKGGCHGCSGHACGRPRRSHRDDRLVALRTRPHR